MSTECIEIPGDPYPQTSELLTLPYCLSSDCNSVDSTIIIETKINTVEGVVRYVDGKKIKVGYNAVEAGYPPCYVLSQCEIVSVRCYNCCDDRYFDLGSCALTTETISAALGVTQLTGEIYLYSGDIADPDCLYKYSGFGPITDPSNWYDAFGNLAAQFAQLEGNSLATFLSWLASVFEGDGISFNVHEDGDKIIVTVGGGSGGNTASFSFDYTAGTITGNPNDGSGDVITNIIVKQPNAPSLPYDWFLFVNTTSKALFVNVNGEAMMLGFLEDGEPTTCTDVVGCLVNNFDAGAPDPDQWALPEMVGPFWEIGSVIYGDGPSVADFSGCPGSDLDDLILSLNTCPTNPEQWIWVNNGGVLTLCTPAGSGILTMEYGDVPMVKNFAGVPTVAGDPTPDMCLEIAECIDDRNLISTLKYGAGTDEAAIQAEFSTLNTVTVRWVDGDGDQRVSYKDPANGWYHPISMKYSVETTELGVEMEFNLYSTLTVRWVDAEGDQRVSYKDPTNGWYHPADKVIAAETVVYSASKIGLPTAAPFAYAGDIDLVALGVPSDAKYVDLVLHVSLTRLGFRPPGSSPLDLYSMLEVSSSEFAHSGSQVAVRSYDNSEGPTTTGELIEHVQKIRSPMNSNGLLSVTHNAQNGAAGQSVSRGDYSASVFVTGWSR